MISILDSCSPLLTKRGFNEAGQNFSEKVSVQSPKGPGEDFSTFPTLDSLRDVQGCFGSQVSFVKSRLSQLCQDPQSAMKWLKNVQKTSHNGKQIDGRRFTLEGRSLC